MIGYRKFEAGLPKTVLDSGDIRSIAICNHDTCIGAVDFNAHGYGSSWLCRIGRPPEHRSILDALYVAGKPAAVVEARDQAPFGAICSLLKRLLKGPFEDENVPHLGCSVPCKFRIVAKSGYPPEAQTGPSTLWKAVAARSNGIDSGAILPISGLSLSTLVLSNHPTVPITAVTTAGNTSQVKVLAAFDPPSYVMSIQQFPLCCLGIRCNTREGQYGQYSSILGQYVYLLLRKITR